MTERPPPDQLQVAVTCPDGHLSVWPIGYILEGPTAPFLGLSNLQEWLTGLRETFYLLGYLPVYYKSVQFGGCRMEEMQRHSVGRERRVSSPGAPPCQHLHVFTNPGLSELVYLFFSGDFIM